MDFMAHSYAGDLSTEVIHVEQSIYARCRGESCLSYGLNILQLLVVTVIEQKIDTAKIYDKNACTGKRKNITVWRIRKLEKKQLLRQRNVRTIVSVAHEDHRTMKDDKEVVRYRLGTGGGYQFLQSSHRQSLFYYEYALRQVRWYVLQL